MYADGYASDSTTRLGPRGLHFYETTHDENGLGRSSPHRLLAKIACTDDPRKTHRKASNTTLDDFRSSSEKDFDSRPRPFGTLSARAPWWSDAAVAAVSLGCKRRALPRISRTLLSLVRRCWAYTAAAARTMIQQEEQRLSTHHQTHRAHSWWPRPRCLCPPVRPCTSWPMRPHRSGNAAFPTLQQNGL